MPYLALEFAPGGSLDAVELEAELSARRERDMRRRSATYGPHRDDLDVQLSGRSVRRLNYGTEAEIIGQVTAVAMRLTDPAETGPDATAKLPKRV